MIIRGLVFVGGVPRVAPHIRERLSERVRALEGARDLIGWGAGHLPFLEQPDAFAAAVKSFLRTC